MTFKRLKGKMIADKAKRPQPGIVIKPEVVLDLIPKFSGNVSRIADALGCNRHTVWRKCQDNPILMQALEDARERRIDELECAVHEDAIAHQDATMRIFLLKTLGKHRGYEQSEAQNTAKDIATAAFDFILNKSKNPAES